MQRAVNDTTSTPAGPAGTQSASEPPSTSRTDAPPSAACPTYAQLMEEVLLFRGVNLHLLGVEVLEVRERRRHGIRSTHTRNRTPSSSGVGRRSLKTDCLFSRPAGAREGAGSPLGRGPKGEGACISAASRACAWTGRRGRGAAHQRRCWRQHRAAAAPQQPGKGVALG